MTQTITIAKAQPAPLTLFATPASIAVGGGAGGTSALSTAGGSGTGAITYVVTSGACIVTPPSSLTSAVAGSCTVEARQAADAGFNAGKSNPVAIQVGPGAQAGLLLTASPTSISVNGTSALSTTGGSGSGAVTYAVNSGPCTIVGSSSLRGTARGQCQVVATKAGDGSYGPATSNPVTVTVNSLAPPALVLTANPTTVGFGGSSALATSGGIPGAPVSYGVTGPCSVSGNTLIGTSGGDCVITATQAETSLYSAATSGPVTVTVKERTTVFGYPQAIATIGRPFVLTPVTGGFTSPTFALLYGNLAGGADAGPGHRCHQRHAGRPGGNLRRRRHGVREQLLRRGPGGDRRAIGRRRPDALGNGAGDPGPRARPRRNAARARGRVRTAPPNPRRLPAQYAAVTLRTRRLLLWFVPSALGILTAGVLAGGAAAGLSGRLGERVGEGPLALPTPGAAPAVPASGTFRIVALGDSLTRGAGDAAGGGGYPERVAAALRKAGLTVDGRQPRGRWFGDGGFS